MARLGGTCERGICLENVGEGFALRTNRTVLVQMAHHMSPDCDRPRRHCLRGRSLVM
jgi:hypothetical protein